MQACWPSCPHKNSIRHRHNCAITFLDFYADLSLPIETRENASRWQGVLSDLSQLKSTFLPPPVADEAAH